MLDGRKGLCQCNACLLAGKVHFEPSYPYGSTLAELRGGDKNIS